MSTNHDNDIDWQDLIRLIDHNRILPVISRTVGLDYLSKHRNIAIQDWAKDISYPLSDRSNLARVAQFRCVMKNPESAKWEYLAFLNRKLLKKPKDPSEADYRPVSEVATELGFFNFEEKPDHPLHRLAQLPLSIYLTTSHHGFVELALEAAGRDPQVRAYCWSESLRADPPTTLERYLEPATPSIKRPIVYHAFGIDTVPESMALSEDDYFEFLKNIESDLTRKTSNNPRVLPPEIDRALREKSFVMFGYSFYDWAFRAAFRGVIQTIHHETNKTQPPQSLLIQFSSELEIEKENRENVRAYLGQYVHKFNFDINWDDVQGFIEELWRTWDRSPYSKKSSTSSGPRITKPEKRTTRPTVFISYSREDEQEKSTLEKHLGVLKAQALIDLWSDDRIEVGVDRETAIGKAIGQARVAILLISASFLNSDILMEEAQALRKQREGKKLTIFPVIAKDCVWHRVEWLHKMSTRPKHGAPVWREGGDHVDEDLAVIAEEVAALIEYEKS